MDRRLSAGLLTVALIFLITYPALAGTTGGLRGRITDRETQRGIPGIRVTVSSPSQTATTTTDANGTYVFLSLSPDTYTISVSPPGYDAALQSGINVVSDQVQTASLVAVKTIRTIGRTSSRSASNIVRPGTTSDVYSVNASAQEAAQALGGPGSLNQAYSGMASVPGISVPQGQQGWNQLVYVRGGDYEDVAVELDGIPMQRASDSAPQSTLSSLGQQELQVYSGGAPASADASGLSGYVNQVIRTGTYPGFQDLQIGVGGPAFYHKLSVEVGGATQNRNFSYYLGFSGVNQDYRYGDQFNGASNNSNFFAPLYVPSLNSAGAYDGSGTPYFSPGQNYSIANTNDRETVANFHFGLPHKNGEGKDDIQLLYVTSEIFAQFYGSVNDLGGAPFVNSALTEQYGAPTTATYIDNYVYKGSLMTPLTGNEPLTPWLFPSSGNHVFAVTQLNDNLREANTNGIGLVKLQYQKNINDRSYFRIFGYSNYSNWFINGPVSANLNYGGEIADYEVDAHGFGANARYENQLNAKNLLTVTASYQTQKLQTYSNGSNAGEVITNLIDKNGNCYTPVATTQVNSAGKVVPVAAGSYASCFTAIGPTLGGGENVVTQFGSTPNSLTPGIPPAGSPAAANGAYWAATENGQNAQIDNVTPFFTAYSLSDQFRPSDKLTINAGLRFENYLYRLNYSAGDYPARSFWFNAYNRENCYLPGSPAPVSSGPINPHTGAFPACPANSIALVDTVPATSQYSALEPRVGTTYTINPDTVLRASYGRYAQQPGTSYQLFDVVQQNLPSFISQFLPYGYNSPYHATTPSYSNSYDFSLEKHLHGTDYSFKLTPFYRSTQAELQSVPIGSQGVLDGINTGTGRNYGVEFEFSKGDFARQGLSYQLSYTYTNSKISFGNFQSGNNFIDNLNAYVKQYNAFTSACAANPGNPQCGSTPTGVAAAPCYVAGAPAACGAAGAYANPYWNAKPEPLFDRTAEYVPYDILPSPFQGANAYLVPNLVTGILNYRRGKLTLTPSATYSSGSFYGSPLTWPGYDPTTCSGATATTTLQQSCTGAIFIPDVYTGKFDNQGAFEEPTRLTVNFQTAYEINPKVRVVVTLTGLVDHCYQRGYAWDNAATCVYAQLPSNHLAPVGNFLTGTGIPVPTQLAYPYSSWYNNSQTGYVGQKIPFNAFVNLEVKL